MDMSMPPIRRLVRWGLLALALLACRSNPQLREEAYLSLPTLPEVGYKQEDLRKIGAVEAYRRVKVAGFKPTLNLLYSMAGA